jgi:integrase
MSQACSTLQNVIPLRKQISSAITFGEAAESFQNSLHNPTRRGSRAPNTIKLHRFNARKIVEHLGHLPLEQVRNAAVKGFVASLREEDYSPASISSFFVTLKMIVRSIKTEEGECIHNFNYDSEFIAAPIVDPASQTTPCATREQIESAIQTADGPTALFVALGAASGLRASELMALEIGNVQDRDCIDLDAGLIFVRKTLKTKSAARTIPLPAAFIAWLRERITRTDGKLFIKSQLTIRRALNKMRVPAPHAYRRFFVSHRRRMNMPEEIVKRITGHSIGGDITSRYSRAAHDLDWIRAEVEKAGVGFAF